MACNGIALPCSIYVFRRFRKIAKSDYQLCHVCLSVRPSVRMEQLGSRWTLKKLISDYFRKPVEKIQVSLKSNKNKGYFI
jgi:hypothetical protein